MASREKIASFTQSAKSRKSPHAFKALKGLGKLKSTYLYGPCVPILPKSCIFVTTNVVAFFELLGIPAKREGYELRLLWEHDFKADPVGAALPEFARGLGALSCLIITHDK